MFKHQSLARNLFSMTWPMLLGTLSLMSFQLVDSFYISLLGTEPLAALGFTMPLNQVMIGIQVGIGIAATALISRALGAEQNSYAKQLTGLILLVGSLCMAVLAAAIYLAKQPILLALGAEQNLYPYTDSYWLPWLISTWFHAFLYFGTSFSRAYGDTKLPGMIMVATSIMNIILDPIFIFVLGLGLPGAALATTTSSFISITIMQRRLIKRHWLSFDFQQLAIVDALKSVASISLPAMLSQLMPSMAALAATRVVAFFGSAAVAAWALGTRLETFSIVMVLALTMSMPPMLGHLLGAKKLSDADKLVRIAVRFTILLQLGIAAFWLLLRPVMVSTLTQDETTAHYLSSYMILVPVSYSALGVCILMVSICNALGMPMRALVISILRLFAFYLPCLGIGAYFIGMEGIYYGVLVGNLAAGINGWRMYRRGLNKLAPKVS